MNGFLVAGTASGVGKTTVALALMAALRRQGHIVQPFKCGPDFLDPSHHTMLCQRPSRNLDTWMLSLEANRNLFAKAVRDADWAVIEGMMGLYDGVDGASDAGSSAEIAKLLHVPIVLVVDAGMSGRSLAAVVRGFSSFDTELSFAGLVLNRVAGENHFQILQTAIRQNCEIPILGWLPCSEAAAIPERHLGLQTAGEFSDWSERRQALAAFAEKHLDLGLLSKHTHINKPPVLRTESSIDCSTSVRVGVARDVAFSFYYEDNLELLQEAGAELVSFSPLKAQQLPPQLDALYLGGGYPELYAQELSGNASLLQEIRDFAAAGKPLYAECGGMIYLAESLTLLDGERISLAGVLPLQIAMTKRLNCFGYTEVILSRECFLGEEGSKFRGHSFHYSSCGSSQQAANLYDVHYRLSGRHEREGYSVLNVVASYMHLHFLSAPSIARSFVEKARKWKEVQA